MKSGFVFSQTDTSPMYQQIMEQIKQRIAVGDWPPQTPLPSVRELASEIKVSIITIKRAYLELGREGVIITQQGKGSWVSDALDMKLLQRQELMQHLEQAGKLAKSLSLSEEKVLQMLKPHME
jgi:GntR family transcriptional regulator